MKLLLLLLVCSISIIAGAQKFSLITRANMNTAAGEQVHKFKNAYGMGIGFEMAVKKTSPVKWVVMLMISIVQEIFVYKHFSRWAFA